MAAQQAKRGAKKAKTRKSGPRGGRPPHEPTDELRGAVRAMKSAGATTAAIGRVLQLSEDTLDRYYRQELDEGLDVVVAEIAHLLVKQAMSGNLTAQIFFLKARGGWREGGMRSPEPGDAPSPIAPMASDSKVVFFLPDNGRGDTPSGEKS